MAAHTSAIAVAIDGTVYAGTFEEGIYRSDDDGHSWKQLGLIDTDIRGLVIDHRGRLLAGTFGDGVYLSTDRGETWDGFNTGLADSRVQSLIGNGEGAILAGTFGSGVFALRDETTWHSSNDGLTDLDVRSLAFGTRETAYAACRRDGVFLSTDSGQTWSRFDGGSPLGALRFVAASRREIVAAGWVGGVARNYQGEGAWTRIAEGLPNQKVWTVAVLPGGQLLVGMHGHGIYAFDEASGTWRSTGLEGGTVTAITAGINGDVWIGTRTGIYRSKGPDYDWRLMGIPRSYVFSLATTTGGTIIAATYESGLLRSSNRGVEWVPTDRHHEDVYTVVSDGGHQFAGGIAGRVFESDDDGRSWTITNKDPGDEWTRAPIRSLAVQRRRVLAGSEGDGVLRSEDGGITWKRVGLDGHVIWSLAMDESGLTYAGTSTGLFRSVSGGETWDSITDEVVRAGVFSIHIDRDEGLLVGTPDGVARSTDGGTTWEKNGLQSRFVTSILRGANGTVYAATFGDGVFARKTPDTTWMHLDKGLDNRFVRSLAYLNSGNDTHELFAATDGDGVFNAIIPVVTVDAIPEQPVVTTLYQNYPNPFATSTTISFSLPRATTLRLDVYNVQGQLVDRLPPRYLPSGHHQVEWHAGDLSSGVYYYILECEAGRASQRLILLR
ncbi:MAG: T9SS type A sorting domain-containing protein [Rhodothermales bacterium]|nr:T9SS type A sorting domain-containing protein [Rhodothermales bacterium]